MERLETKKISGHTYYYYSEWGWVNGKCRRKWQRLWRSPELSQPCSWELSHLPWWGIHGEGWV